MPPAPFKNSTAEIAAFCAADSCCAATPAGAAACCMLWAALRAGMPGTPPPGPPPGGPSELARCGLPERLGPREWIPCDSSSIWRNDHFPLAFTRPSSSAGRPSSVCSAARSARRPCGTARRAGQGQRLGRHCEGGERRCRWHCGSCMRSHLRHEPIQPPAAHISAMKEPRNIARVDSLPPHNPSLPFPFPLPPPPPPSRPTSWHCWRLAAMSSRSLMMSAKSSSRYSVRMRCCCSPRSRLPTRKCMSTLGTCVWGGGAEGGGGWGGGRGGGSKWGA
jgi:hypothetical protein